MNPNSQCIAKEQRGGYRTRESTLKTASIIRQPDRNTRDDTQKYDTYFPVDSTYPNRHYVVLALKLTKGKWIQEANQVDNSD